MKTIADTTTSAAGAGFSESECVFQQSERRSFQSERKILRSASEEFESDGCVCQSEGVQSKSERVGGESDWADPAALRESCHPLVTDSQDERPLSQSDRIKSMPDRLETGYEGSRALPNRSVAVATSQMHRSRTVRRTTY